MIDIHAAVDYPDEVRSNGLYYDKAHIHDLMAYLADMGLTKVEWITYRNLKYDLDGNHSYDLLAEVVDAAHSNGIECHTVIKLLDGASGGYHLPHSLPKPEGTPFLEQEHGLYPAVDPFIAANPEMQLRRNPEQSGDPGGALATIRLIKDNDAPTRTEPEELVILTSETNARFEPYEGPIAVRESVEWRDHFPKLGEFIVNTPSGKYTGAKRIIHLEGLEIPASERFVLVECPDDDDGDLTNELGQLLELENEDGDPIPYTPGSGWTSNPFDEANEATLQLTPYLRHPQVRKALEELGSAKHYRFASDSSDVSAEWTLDQAGNVCVMRGKPEYLTGNLHPAYPEVREHWLDVVRECIDAGVDGVNFRFSHHTRSHEMWEYGYNDPVVDRSAERVNHAAVAQANGESFTTFLREAADLLRRHDRQVGVHLFAELFACDDRPHGIRGNHAVMHIPANVEWQWETWIHEIADYVQFRRLNELRPWRRRRIIDRVGQVVSEASMSPSVIYQGHIKPALYDPTHRDFQGWEPLVSEIEFAREHPAIDAYQLYETNSFTRITENGTFEGNEELAAVIRDHGIE